VSCAPGSWRPDLRTVAALCRVSRRRPPVWLGLAAILVAALAVRAADTIRPPADAWFTNQFTWPGFVPTQAVRAAGFENLHAADSAGRLKIFWAPARMDTNAEVCLFASADAPGHWPVRDWRSYAAIERGTNWEAKFPVDDVDVPVAYFLGVTVAGKTNYSPLRMAHPRELGLEEPSRIFGPFLEGFEEGLASWRLTAAEDGAVQLADEAKNGRHALLITLPAGKRSVTIGTTRVRGWRTQYPGVSGLSVWLRTRSGEATARLALHANAFSMNQVVSTCPREIRVTGAWQRVDVAFDSFPNLPLANVDWFSLEFSADGPREILLDDLQFLGPWKLEPE